MNIWLVTIGEPVPYGEGVRDRLYRTGYFGQFLAGQGHEVTWWASAFDHNRKRLRVAETTQVRLESGLDLRLLYGGGYRRNLSWSRVRDHRRIGQEFARLTAAETRRPDVILCSLPTIELCSRSVEFGRRHGIPVVLDMRDMWPDIFSEMAPRLLRPLVRLACRPMFLEARRACGAATAITGITESFVDWGLGLGARCRSRLDRAFVMGYAAKAPPPERLRAAEEYWDQQGIRADDGVFTVAFFGAIGRQLDVRTIVLAARELAQERAEIRFVLCGEGDRLPELRRLAGDLPNVKFTGWVDAAAIHVLMRRSQVGIDPLPDRFDFHATINNKAIEYLSAGLPIISSPERGVLAELLAREQCGLSHAYGDIGSLKTILKQLAQDPVGTRRLAENSARLFHRGFVAEVVYSEMRDYLAEVAEQGTRGASSRRRAA